MSPLIRVLTVLLLALPVVFAAAALAGRPGEVVAVSLGVLYLYIWLRVRPTRFELTDTDLHIVWPWRRVTIPMTQIATARVASVGDLRKGLGLALRVGVGGLWGGFGLLWTRRRGWVQMYVSRTDGLVWIERKGGRPFLLTPAEPEAFVAALASTLA